MTREEAQELLKKLNKAKIGGEAGAGYNGFGNDLSLKSHVKFGIPTRIPELDLSIGRPGLPAGRVVEFYGLPMSGKTTAALHALASCQRMGGTAIFIDTELSFDPERATDCGVDPSTLMVLESRDIEEIFEKIEIILKSHEPDGLTPLLICVDSITGVQTRLDHARDIGEGSRVGENARAIRLGLQKINQLIADAQATVVFINHSTALIGKSFGKQSDSAGGNGIKFFASLRVEFQFVANITEKDEDDNKIRRGQKSTLNLTKNKVAQTNNPSFTLELTERGFDLYEGLWQAYQKVGALDKINNMNYHFLPTGTTFARRDWNAFVDKFEDKTGKLWGLDGFYKHFLTIAVNDEHIGTYGAKNGTGSIDQPDSES